MSDVLYSVIVTGENAGETTGLLQVRLAELCIDGSSKIRVEAAASTEAGEDTFVYSMGSHDTPGFAVEKILDQLADRGWISLDQGLLGPEEEEQIRARLQGLGYVD
jgi:hypothetical protein